MNKTALRYGLISTVLVAILFIPCWLYFREDMASSTSKMIGYSLMAIILIPAVLAVMKRRQEKGGVISFGDAFATALLTSFIACIAYTVCWLLVTYSAPEIVDQMMENMKTAQGKELTPEELKEFDKMEEMYNKPHWRAMFTFFEIALYAIPVSLVGAIALKKK